MRRSSPLWLILLVLLTATPASAKLCGAKVTAQGYCESALRVIWCEHGEEKTLDCKLGSVCAWSDALRAFDCVDASCGDVPVTGRCAAELMVVKWCDAGTVRSLKCAIGTSCGWSEKTGAFDCLPAGPAPDTGNAAGDATQSGSDVAPTAVPDSGLMVTSDAGGLPPPKSDVQSATDAGATPSLSGGGGCHAGARPLPGAALLSALVVLVAWRASAGRSRDRRPRPPNRP